MIPGRPAALTCLLAALSIVVVSLARRRLPQRQISRLALLWLGIIASVWIIAELGLVLAQYFT